MEKRVVPFELKQVDLEEGTFEGYAAVFGNPDAGNDVIEPGAFTKTLQENGHRVKICWQHDPREPIGRPVEMKEDQYGLWVKGKVSLTTKGRDALILLRDGVVNELSIGYDTIKHQYQGAVRQLKELKLWEFSLVTWAMNELAAVTNVKEGQVLSGKAADFQSILLVEQLEDNFWKLFRALRMSIESVVADATILDKVTVIAANIDQFKAAVLGWLAQAMAANVVQKSFNLGMSEKAEMVFDLDIKAGRTISGKNREILGKCHERVRKVHDDLTALLDATEPASTTPSGEGAADDTGKGAGGTHSDADAVMSLITELKETAKLFKEAS